MKPYNMSVLCLFFVMTFTHCSIYSFYALYEALQYMANAGIEIVTHIFSY